MDIHESQIINSDSRCIPLPDACAHATVTSPPYYLQRDYCCQGQLGQEQTVRDYVDGMVGVFREVRRVLRDDGICFVNVGTTYDKGCDLQVPQRLAIALQDDGWFIVADVVWSKISCSPETVTRRPTRAHEKIIIIAKSSRYYWDAQAVRDFSDIGGSKNIRSVWRLPVQSRQGSSHTAMLGDRVAEFGILLGSSDAGCCPACGAPYRRVLDVGRITVRGGKTALRGQGFGSQQRANRPDRDKITQPIYDTVGWEPTCQCEAGDPVPCIVLDPFSGSGTVPCVSHRLGRVGIGIDLNPNYCLEAQERLKGVIPVSEPPVPPKGYCYAADTCVAKPKTPTPGFRYVNIALWADVVPLMKKPKLNSQGGRPRESDRKMLDGILTHLLEGVPWRRLPEDVCVGMTAWRRYRKWEEDGTWERILPVLKNRYPDLRMPDAA